MTLSICAKVGYRGTEIHTLIIRPAKEISNLSLSVSKEAVQKKIRHRNSL